MFKETVLCDACRKELSSLFSDKGMIQISGDNLQFWVSEGLRKIDGHPKDSDGEVLKRVRDKQGWGVVHFCNTVCFAEFLKRGH